MKPPKHPAGLLRAHQFPETAGNDSNHRLLKRTTSRCPVCHTACPAEVWRVEGAGGGPFETLATCLALIEIVNSCNLSCPTCYADSPPGAGAKVDAVPLADLQRRIQGVIERKNGLEILQLSGGEPTLHPQLFELLEWAHAHPRIDYLLLNTNGVRLANEPDFAERLGRMFAKGGLQLYLQFDGVQEAAQRALRGADLRELRERALERCAAANLPVTLAMTVTGDNLPHLWEAIEFGLARPIVHGVTFQPMFESGRVSSQWSVVSSRERPSLTTDPIPHPPSPT